MMYLFKVNGFTCQCETVDELYAAIGNPSAPTMDTSGFPAAGSVQFKGPATMSKRWQAVDQYIQEHPLKGRQTRKHVYNLLFGSKALKG